MITFETLREWAKKCLDAKKTVEEQYKQTQEVIDEKLAYKAQLEKHLIAVNAQIETLEQLMDIEKNPPAVDIPSAGPDIDKVYADRLKGWDDREEMDMYRERQEKTYKKEAKDIAEQIHAVNVSAKRTDAKSTDTNKDS